MVTVETVSTAHELEELGGAWESLLDNVPGTTLFQSHAFACTWWAHFGAGRKLRVQTVRDGGELLGVAPLVLGRESYNGLPVQMLSFMANKHTSRSDIMARAGSESAVAETLVSYWVTNHGEWDVLRLTHIPARGGTLERLMPLLQKVGLEAFGPEPTRELVELTTGMTWEEYETAMGRKFRSNVRNAFNRIQKDTALRFETHRTAEEVGGSMRQLFDLQQRSWKEDDHDAGLDDADQAYTIALARRIAATGGFRNWFLMDGDKAIAAVHGLVYRDALYFFHVFYDQAYAHLSPGRALVARALMDMFADPHIRRVDFNGESGFIRQWSEQRMQLAAVSVCNRGTYSRVISGLKHIKRLAGAGLRGGA